MICFLTSSISVSGTGKINSANHFIDRLKIHFPQLCRVVVICSDPDNWEITEYYAFELKRMFEDEGFYFEQFDIVDSRNETLASKLVPESNVLILLGGHVPTQNQFFKKIFLRELLKDYAGVVIGISAGSMNSADSVYAQPEKEGEAIDPTYQRFLNGLNLTNINLLPHYQALKNERLDGMKLFEDIACRDSMGKIFYAIPDGSYLLIVNGKAELHGEAYSIRNGKIRQLTVEGETIKM